MDMTIIEQLADDGALDIKSMLDALSDGAYLAKKEWAQEDVEGNYNFLTTLLHLLDRK